MAFAARISGESSERTWVYRIAHSVALTWQAGHKRRQYRQMPLDDGPVPAVNPLNPERIDLQRAIAQLKPADRSLILLWLEGLTAQEICEVTGIQAPTGAVRLGRIRKQLSPSEVQA